MTASKACTPQGKLGGVDCAGQAAAHMPAWGRGQGRGGGQGAGEGAENMHTDFVGQAAACERHACGGRGGTCTASKRVHNSHAHTCTASECFNTLPGYHMLLTCSLPMQKLTDQRVAVCRTTHTPSPPPPVQLLHDAAVIAAAACVLLLLLLLYHLIASLQSSMWRRADSQ
jgi:hypothetical protein